MSLPQPEPAEEDPAEPPSQPRRESRIEALSDTVEQVSEKALARVEEHVPAPLQSRVRRLRERVRARRSLDTMWRVAVFALGITLLAAGLVMFVLPGPGFATIILGLVVLGSEFAWASRALDPVKAAARRASEAALDPKRRRRNLAISAVLGVAVGLIAWWYLRSYGLTVAPIIGWVQGLSG